MLVFSIWQRRKCLPKGTADIFAPFLAAAEMLKTCSASHLSRAFRELGRASIRTICLMAWTSSMAATSSRSSLGWFFSPRNRNLLLGSECISSSRLNTTAAVRSSEHLEKVLGLAGHRLMKRQVSNHLLRVSRELFSFCENRIAGSLENPKASVLWLHPLVSQWVLEATGESLRKHLHLV